MNDPQNIPGVSPTGSESEPVSLVRRRFGGLLALLGGGAVASCGVAAGEGGGLVPGIGQAVSPAVTSSLTIEYVESVETDLLGASSGGLVGASGDIVFALGYKSRLDGGGGLFVWVPATPPTSDDGVDVVPWVNPGSGYVRNTTGFWRRVYTGPLNVAWFGAVGSGLSTRDDAPAIRNAVFAASRFPDISGHGQEIYFPPGSYIVRGEIEIALGQIHLRGAGPYLSRIEFRQPGSGPGDVTIFKFLNPTVALGDGGSSTGYHYSNRLAFASVRGLAFSADASETGSRKIAIAFLNTDRCVVEDVQVGPGWTTSGSGYDTASIGIQVIAGQLNYIHRVSIAADRPISIDRIPSGQVAGIATCDHLHLSDLTLSPKVDQPSIAIDQDVLVLNLVIDGTNSFNGGQWGIYWTAQNSVASTHSGILISNIRVEGLTKGSTGSYPSASYADLGSVIYMRSSTTAVRGLRIVNVTGPGSPNQCAGLRLKNVLYGRVESCYLASYDRALHLESSFVECVTSDLNAVGALAGAMRDVRWRVSLANAATSTLTGVVPVAFFKTATISVSGIYETGSSGTTICEAGVWQATKYGVTKLSGTSKTADVVTTDTFSLVFSSGALVLRNDLTATCTLDCTIVFEHTS